MKFISKNANLRIVLKQGLPAEKLTGRVSVPAVYVKFENGLVTVNDKDKIEMMLAHSGFNSDYIAVEEDGKDPFINTRKESEPEHNITEITHGSIGKSITPKASIQLSQEQRTMMMEMAKKMALTMAPELAKEILKEQMKDKVEPEKINPLQTTIDEHIQNKAETESVEPSTEPVEPPVETAELVEPEPTEGVSTAPSTPARKSPAKRRAPARRKK